MRDLASLNINEGGEPVTRSPPTDIQVAQFQREFSVKIPDELLQILHYANGGCPEVATFKSAPHSTWSLDHFYYLNDDKGIGSLWDGMATWGPILGRMRLPFAEDGGGNPFFLDLNFSPPTVMVHVHDRVAEPNVFLSNSLSDFIDSLYQENY